MGALLEPTLYYSAKNGTPSSDVGRYAQPNVFLDKVNIGKVNVNNIN